jgi:hypothetical protein
VKPNDLSNYYAVRRLMRPGDAITWAGDEFLSWIIRRKKPAVAGDVEGRSHVSGVVTGPATVDRKLIVEADQGEVNARRLSAKLAGYKGRAWWHQLRPELDVFRKPIDRFHWEAVGLDYDELSVVRNAYRRVMAAAGAYFCSELYGEAIRNNIPADVIARNWASDLLSKGIALRPIGIACLPVWGRVERIL